MTAPLRRLGLGEWGARLSSPRAAGWVNLRDLCCPEGHRIRQDQFLLEDGVLRCKYRAAAGEPECGRLLYLVTCVVPRTPEREPSVCFAVEVTIDEVRALRAERLGPFDTLRRLGVSMSAPGGGG